MTEEQEAAIEALATEMKNNDAYASSPSRNCSVLIATWWEQRAEIERLKENRDYWEFRYNQSWKVCDERVAEQAKTIAALREALKEAKRKAYTRLISQAPDTPPERLMLYRFGMEVFDEILASLDAKPPRQETEKPDLLAGYKSLRSVNDWPDDDLNKDPGACEGCGSLNACQGECMGKK